MGYFIYFNFCDEVFVYSYWIGYYYCIWLEKVGYVIYVYVYYGDLIFLGLWLEN